MNLRLLFVLSLGLAACVGESAPASFDLRPTTSHPDSLLSRLDRLELATAMERLREAGYTAEVRVLEIEGGQRMDVHTRTIEVSVDSVRVLDPSGSGASEAASFGVFDPVARLLPKEPPFQNSATREMYSVTRGNRNGAVARARAERREGTDPIQSAEVAVDTTTGQVVWARVVRESQSAVFDEASEATVRLSRHDGSWWPTSGQLVTAIDVPLSDAPRRQLEWRVLSIGGSELAPATSSTE